MIMRKPFPYQAHTGKSPCHILLLYNEPHRDLFFFTGLYFYRLFAVFAFRHIPSCTGWKARRHHGQVTSSTLFIFIQSKPVCQASRNPSTEKAPEPVLCMTKSIEARKQWGSHAVQPVGSSALLQPVTGLCIVHQGRGRRRESNEDVTQPYIRLCTALIINSLPQLNEEKINQVLLQRKRLALVSIEASTPGAQKNNAGFSGLSLFHVSFLNGLTQRLTSEMNKANSDPQPIPPWPHLIQTGVKRINPPEAGRATVTSDCL